MFQDYLFSLAGIAIPGHNELYMWTALCIKILLEWTCSRLIYYMAIALPDLGYSWSREVPQCYACVLQGRSWYLWCCNTYFYNGRCLCLITHNWLVNRAFRNYLVLTLFCTGFVLFQKILAFFFPRYPVFWYTFIVL